MSLCYTPGMHLHRLLAAVAVLAGCFAGPAGAGLVYYLDDEDTGWSTTGAWTEEAAANARNDDEYYESNSSSAATATWSFSGLPQGRYMLYASAAATGNRTTAARYTLSDDIGLIGTVNQQAYNHDIWREVGGDNSNGEGYWRVSPDTFYVGDGTLDVTASDAVAGLYLMADAVRLESVRPDAGAVYVVDNDAVLGNRGTYTETGAWSGYALDANDHALSIRYAAADPANIASYNFTGLTPGASYRVSATWTAGGNRSTQARYYVDGGPSVTLSQLSAPTDDMFEDVPWEDLFTFVPSGSTLTVRLSAASVASGVLAADAVRLELVPEPSTLGLGVLSLAALLRGRRRKPS